MKLLVTGGCGFLGSNIAAEAIEQGRDVVVFDNLSRSGSAENRDWLRSRGDFEFVHGDIRAYEDVCAVVDRIQPDAVFHLAGQVAMSTSVAQPRVDFQINAGGTHNLLEAIRLFAPEAAVLYASTNKVYGDLEQFEYRETATRYEVPAKPNGFDESVPLEFRTPYGCSKGAADQYVLDYAHVFGLRTAVFRHSSMYGGRQFATYDQGWVGWFCGQAIEAETEGSRELTISGTGKQVRDLLHVDDAVRVYFACLDRIDAVTAQVFNIGGGIDNSLSLLELFAKLEELRGVKLSYTSLPERQSDQRVFVVDGAKARRLLGWSPNVGVDEGVSRMLDWLTERRVSA
jgi:CDP-paratose 2-epimerase